MQHRFITNLIPNLKLAKMAMATNVGSFLAVVVLFMTLANASVHRVGGAAGWNSGVNYKAWASSNPIVLGDTLSKLASYLSNKATIK